MSNGVSSPTSGSPRPVLHVETAASPRSDVTSPELLASPTSVQDAEYCLRYALKMRELESELLAATLEDQETLINRVNYYKKMILEREGGADVMFLPKEELQAQLRALRK